jgi:hypothetical protein
MLTPTAAPRFTERHLLRPPPCPTVASSSSTPRRCTSVTLPALAPTTPPAPQGSFSPLVARRRGQPAPASLRPIRPHPKHRATKYDLPALRAADHHLRTPPPTDVPLRPTTHCRGAHSFGEDLPVPTPQMGAPHCRVALVPVLHRPRSRQDGVGWATASAAVG